MLTSVCSHHVGASAGEHHVPGVELKTADGPLMLPVQDGHLHPTLSAPHVNSSILGACMEEHSGAQVKRARHNTQSELGSTHRSWQTASQGWSRPPEIRLYCCCSPKRKGRKRRRQTNRFMQSHFDLKSRCSVEQKVTLWMEWRDLNWNVILELHNLVSMATYSFLNYKMKKMYILYIYVRQTQQIWKEQIKQKS